MGLLDFVSEMQAKESHELEIAARTSQPALEIGRTCFLADRTARQLRSRALSRKPSLFPLYLFHVTW
jgi:hypothetical protein